MSNVFYLINKVLTYKPLDSFSVSCSAVDTDSCIFYLNATAFTSILVPSSRGNFKFHPCSVINTKGNINCFKTN